jgi:uncharacterized protein with FMN-binding domain
MRKVAGALLATAAGLIALLSFKSHTPAAASALTAAGSSGTSALSGAGSSPTPDTGSGSGSSAPAQSGASPSTTPSGGASGTGSGSGKNGSYTGSAADTMYGPVQVRITVSGGKLTKVDVLQVPDNGRYESEIVADALPILQSEALSAQSANINIVSGATFTSQGYAQSLQSALDQAGIK